MSIFLTDVFYDLSQIIGNELSTGFQKVETVIAAGLTSGIRDRIVSQRQVRMEEAWTRCATFPYDIPQRIFSQFTYGESSAQAMTLHELRLADPIYVRLASAESLEIVLDELNSNAGVSLSVTQWSEFCQQYLLYKIAKTDFETTTF